MAEKLNAVVILWYDTVFKEGTPHFNLYDNESGYLHHIRQVPLEEGRLEATVKEVMLEKQKRTNHAYSFDVEVRRLIDGEATKFTVEVPAAERNS